MTDQELIKGFLKGGRKEYNHVVGWITDVVRAKLWVERVSGDDVIADTIIKLLVNLRDNAFRLESPFKTYVQRITLYTLVDTSRRMKKLEPIDCEDSFADGATPHSVLEEVEQRKLFGHIMSLLPERCRELWTMVFQDQLSCREMAQKLGTTEGAVKTNLSRCKKKAEAIYKELTGNYSERGATILRRRKRPERPGEAKSTK